MSRMTKASVIYRDWDRQTIPEPGAVAMVPEDSGAAIADYRRLWQAVILQAFRDACMSDPPPGWKHRWSTLASSSAKNIPTIRERARQFLLGKGWYFAEVCGNASLDPDMVWGAAQRMLRDEKSVRQANKFFTRDRTPTKGRIPSDMRYLLGAGQLLGRRQLPQG